VIVVFNHQGKITQWLTTSPTEYALSVFILTVQNFLAFFPVDCFCCP